MFFGIFAGLTIILVIHTCAEIFCLSVFIKVIERIRMWLWEPQNSSVTTCLVHLEQIVDMNRRMAKLARIIDWRFLQETFDPFSIGTPYGLPDDAEAYD